MHKSFNSTMKMADSPASPVKSFGNSEEANPIDPPDVTLEKVGETKIISL